ncbi:MAG: acyl transferase [Blastocatellia bacterium]|nr:acyl transferase [Blastocatellia bacterium]
MTVMGRIVSLYPAMILGLAAATVLWFGWRPSPYQPIMLAAIIYLLPPVTLRLHQSIFPIREGASNLSERKYSPWWGAHQIQLIYIAIPQLEALLRMVPGLYSAWLRLCGSKVGRNVYWTPNVEITDRSMMEIGDRVVMGHRTHFFAHAIKPGRRGAILYTRRIKIGNDVFIGAGSRAGPGVVIADGVYLPILTDLYVNQVVESQQEKFE